MKGLVWRNKSRGKLSQVSTSPVSDELHIQQIEQLFDKISENLCRIAFNISDQALTLTHARDNTEGSPAEWRWSGVSKTKPVPPTSIKPSGRERHRNVENNERET